MEDALQFIIDRYNYWIVIVLMMTGLYIVIGRGNLVKKLIGLNLFQTSVFIYYISMGKVAGGTAPIIIGGGGHGEEHGGEHGDGHGEDHVESQSPETQGAAAAGADDHGAAAADAYAPHADESLHAAPSGSHAGDANDLTDAVAEAAPTGAAGESGLHAAPGAGNTLEVPAPAAPNEGLQMGGDAAAASADLVHAAGEIVYSNPLPHVLILTAIVVGVATTAVGLAIAVRIREAYGTIEEDELEAADDIAEFGHDFSEPADARAAS